MEKILAVMNILMATVVLAFGQSPASSNEPKQIGSIDFSKHTPGYWYTLEMMKQDWNPRSMNGDDALDFKGIIHNRGIIVANNKFGGNALRVLLPKDKILPKETGIQIFGFIGGHDEVIFENSIFLPLDFECGKEIKIPPGIYGGWKFATGGIRPDGEKIGPSVRAVLQNCVVKSYIYHLNQEGNNDDGTAFRDPDNGDKFTWKNSEGKPVLMTKGVKHDIKFRVAMNTPGKKDGVHQVWYDGTLVLSLSNIEFRKAPTLQFDTVGVEIFRGGSDLDYATPHDNTMDVGNFKVSVKK
jgi:hypothetical protein